MEFVKFINLFVVQQSPTPVKNNNFMNNPPFSEETSQWPNIRKFIQ